MAERITYPIGQQAFNVLRENGQAYVDKTIYIEKILSEKNQYMFLARPRRFGKSLFLSTLKYFFLGRRELFKGLAVDSMDWDWQKYPVLHLDLNVSTYSSTGELTSVLNSIFTEWEREYGLSPTSSDPDVRFREIIRGAYRSTGRRVVILVDEYDKPLVGNINRKDHFEHYRSQLQSLYSNIKHSAEYIQLVFLTGVSRFSKLSIFSGLNNLLDISFLDEYADICGITERELTDNFSSGIREMAQKNGVDYDEMLAALKLNYDGYRFSERGSDIYNPWSILNALYAKRIMNFWNQTGVPTLAGEMLRKMNVDLKIYLTETKCSLDQINGLTLNTANPLALLFQTGYLTIKDFDHQRQRYTLGIPNREVKAGLLDMLLPFYANLKYENADAYIWKFVDLIDNGDADGFMRALRSFFAGISYEMKMDDENNFQNAFFIFTSLLGLKVQAEAHTSDGRIDLEIATFDYIYIIELKYGKTPQEALSQIETKGYGLKYESDSRQLILIGANFDPETRRIGSWLVKK